MIRFMRMTQASPASARGDVPSPTANDLRIADLVHAAASTVAPRRVDGRAAGRFGERKVFIDDLWNAMLRLDASEGGFRTQGCDIGDLKAWLLRAMRLTDAADAPLVLLSRADLVAAMDPASVARSEIDGGGCRFHFLVDCQAAPEQYVPPRRAFTPIASSWSAHVARA
jgi:hypothetical protein